MPVYSSFVTTMTAPTKKQREAGLDSIKAIFEHLPKEQQLAVAGEPGLLAAVEPFLRGGDKVDTAIDLLLELTNFENGEITATTEKCAAVVFGLPCFSTVKGMAATGGTVELKRKAWIVIVRVSCMENERMKAMFDSAGMVALLQAGLESKDDDIAWRATIITFTLCRSAEVASDLRDSHPA